MAKVAFTVAEMLAAAADVAFKVFVAQFQPTFIAFPSDIHLITIACVSQKGIDIGFMLEDQLLHALTLLIYLTLQASGLRRPVV